jgi:serine/threonine protein kinase/tetratricopeptide (TPR) repeat protein
MTDKPKPDRDANLSETAGAELPATEAGGRPTPSGATAGPPEVEWRDPERIGPYRIVDRLGSGGMGVVYLAEQEVPVRRLVALKLVRADLASWHANTRFAAEQQALARLSHPHVARLYETGETPEGFPFFVMEHVPGVPITDYCDRERLTLDQRLELFCAVCQGVQHAHQNGILHRDIKPANVLVAEVDSRPAPKIIDFGVAKSVDQPLGGVTHLTEGLVVGTLAYISPEAIGAARGELDLDTRADVYALGVLLHELLVGGLPHDTGRESPAQLLENLASADVPRITARFDALGSAERDHIADQRRLSAAGLARDLRGDLEWIVMRAVARDRDERYSSPGELAADIQRHLDDVPIVASPPSVAYRARKFARRHRVGVAAAAAVLVALVAGIAATTAAMLRAQRAEREAAHQAELAEREAETARQARDESESVLDFVLGIFKASQPGETRGELIPVGEVLERGATKIETQLVDKPTVRGRLMRSIGEVYKALGSYPRSVALLQSALAIQQEALGAEDLEVARTLHSLGISHSSAGQPREAAEAHRRSVAIREKLLPPNHPDLGGSFRGLASALSALGQTDEAIEYSRRAVAVIEAAKGPDHVDTAKALAGLASELSAQRRYEEAIASFERARPIFASELGEKHELIGGVHNNVGLLFLDLEDPATGEEHFRKALEIWTVADGPDHPYTFMALTNLASAAMRRRDVDEVRRIADEALPRMTRILGPGHPQTVALTRFLGNALQEAGRYSEAETHLVALLELAESSPQKIPIEIATSLENLGALRVRQGRWAEGERLLRRSLAILESDDKADISSAAFCSYNLGDAAWRQGHHEEARELLRRALAVFEETLVPDSPRLADARLRLARTERDLGNPEAALALLRPAGEVLAQRPGWEPELAEIRKTIAELEAQP